MAACSSAIATRTAGSADAANPNGSCRSIAGVINATGNVLGMMPHPERASEATLGGEDGLYIWHSIIDRWGG